MTDIADSIEIRSLISKCIVGDQYAIETLVHRFETGVFRLALSILDDPMEAAEVTQETFLSALKSLSSYQERASFKTWLFTIALNLSRSRLRKRKALERLRAMLTVVLPLENRKLVSPEETVIQNEKEKAIWQALSTLDEKFRIPVILRYFHELPVAEIAQIMNINEGTIHSRLHHAREQLQATLKSQLTED